MDEPFFTNVEWGKIFNEELDPPFVPFLQSVVSKKRFKGNVLYLFRVIFKLQLGAQYTHLHGTLATVIRIQQTQQD